MCGICGQFNFKDNRAVDRDVIRKMADSITHRGPDDEGFYFDGPLGLGFRRLSIIDLQGGHQPMSDGDETVWIVFNGEIYNFPELKQELEGYGHIFRTSADTEVIIHGYKQWGADVLNHLNGMFGLAVWDVKKRKLIIARDAMGIKLVYFRIDESSVRFSSEIRAFFAAEGMRPEVDPVALNLFLRYRYTPSPHTIFKGIQKLAPGTMLVFEDGNYSYTRWYTYTPKPFSPMKSDNEAAEELLDIYKRALKRHLLSDVPLGILLSGGIDSGLLLGLMNLYGSSWPTFTVGYGETFRDDELTDAARTAEIFSARHTSLQLDRETFESSLPEIVSCLEEPVASSSIVPMYFICRRARQDVKVALVGQGPDELFGGYVRHLGVRYGSWWRWLPEWVRTPVQAGVKAVPRREALKRGVYSLGVADRMKRYHHVFSIVEADRVDGLFHDGILPEGAGNTVMECWADLEHAMDETDELGGFNFLEIRSSLPDELLMYADKLSMAHSLEVRVPYLDRELVEYVQRLSANFKIRYGSRKWLHRRVCNDFLPREIIQRPKRGFAVNVVDDWFNSSLNSKLKDFLQDSSSLMYSFFKPQEARRLLQDHMSGKCDNHKILFSMVVFEEWFRLQKSLC